MSVSGLYEMSSAVHNGHSKWKSISNDLLLFKASGGTWQIDQTVESDTENDDNSDCPSSAKFALFPIQIASQDGLFMSSKFFP